ncbi:hypothetical protein F965_00120 [Acinetobacter schindleri NIPH 900]|uniref:Uncharacterized protein n=1 Tax=Acinetobacter schindleri NIPH 900 TaxID=1217675 RepID=N8Y0B5_9GAMM|nr:hypothetical protein [Acinetobacter schindleri]ENV14774.1 hypothetical protein F965_00120 [Acinetobacter schindleri NIPH 900]
MTNITTILANEAGIQYQGVEDKSSKTGSYPIIGMITGTFKRGRFDKPMTITPANIKAQLGYEPDNPHYMAVMDVLASGVPSVQVVRVKSGGGGGGAISCAGATNHIYIAFYLNAQSEEDLYAAMLSAKLYINDQLFTLVEDDIDAYVTTQELSLSTLPEGLTIPDSPVPGAVIFSISRLSNISDQDLRIVYDVSTNNPNNAIVFAGFGNNPTIMPVEDPRIVKACLAPITFNCADSRDSVYFDHLSDSYNIRVNGVLHEGTMANLPAYIRSDLSDTLDCYNDGFCQIRNLTNINQRIELIPYFPNNFSAPTIGETFTPVHYDAETGHITFCLAPYNPT